MTETLARPDELRGKPSLSMIGLLVVSLIVGYEWFMSGLVKFVRGDFPSGLAAELLEKSKGAPGWYSSLMNSAVIPNAITFGYVIETAEFWPESPSFSAQPTWRSTSILPMARRYRHRATAPQIGARPNTAGRNPLGSKPTRRRMWVEGVRHPYTAVYQ